MCTGPPPAHPTSATTPAPAPAARVRVRVRTGSGAFAWGRPVRTGSLRSHGVGSRANAMNPCERRCGTEGSGARRRSATRPGPARPSAARRGAARRGAARGSPAQREARRAAPGNRAHPHPHGIGGSARGRIPCERSEPVRARRRTGRGRDQRRDRGIGRRARPGLARRDTEPGQARGTRHEARWPRRDTQLARGNQAHRHPRPHEFVVFARGRIPCERSEPVRTEAERAGEARPRARCPARNGTGATQEPAWRGAALGRPPPPQPHPHGIDPSARVRTPCEPDEPVRTQRRTGRRAGAHRGGGRECGGGGAGTTSAPPGGCRAGRWWTRDQWWATPRWYSNTSPPTAIRIRVTPTTTSQAYQKASPIAVSAAAAATPSGQ
ncbi:hypothetical protein C8E95_6487 [Pseudonocardia autotrophica]|uniref:Uncharacterized protein n=1 Tax=Pseudonocardia autotrophica TaxID=2074 RepID=A0A1Y2MQB2_PSEAH|nr:hypothetical protein BG845_04727 [Pseudonocardia autotrophica]TDN77251.1 hypothetical protein C8E95_6487 [Pseudonocardia autotrophica]